MVDSSRALLTFANRSLCRRTGETARQRKRRQEDTVPAPVCKGGVRVHSCTHERMLVGCADEGSAR